MDDRARVDQAVFDLIRPRLKRYRGDVADLSRRVAGAIAQVNSHAESVVTDRRRQLEGAQNELAACLRQQNSDCSESRRRVDQCDLALQEAIRGRDLIRQRSTAFHHTQSAYLRVVEELLLRAEKIVLVADERTSRYQAAAEPISVAPTGDDAGEFAALNPLSWRQLPGVSVPAHFPDGFALIPVELIVDDNPVSGDEDSDAGQGLPTLRWSADALLDVVLPAMSSMTDVLAYLHDRDARERLSGGRSYSATYCGFFSADSAIRLRPLSDGKFHLANGRHQVRLLSRAGAQCVPALISAEIT